MKNVLKFIGAVLFTGLLLAKVSAFHVYEHHDDHDGHDSHCELCLFCIDNQQSEILLVSFELPRENAPLPEFSGKVISENLEFILNPHETRLFCRPPPSLI